MKLKAEKKVIFEVDYHDFDRFVTEIYGGDFEFVAIHEANNYSQYSFDAPSCAMDFDGEVEAKIRQGIYPMYCIHILFNILLKDGHIEEGEYVIKVSW